MNLSDLIKSAEEKLTNPDLTIGTRRREEAILHHLTNLERTVTELASENIEMYVDLCEMGELARAGYTMNRHKSTEDEPKTERVHLYMDDTETQQFFLGGHKFYELTLDKLIRHKWPEEEPEHGKEYLVYSKDEECGCTAYIIAEWKDFLTADECRGPYGDIWEKDNSGWYHYSDDLYLIAVDGVECYWNLPEVTE